MWGSSPAYYRRENASFIQHLQNQHDNWKEDLTHTHTLSLISKYIFYFERLIRWQQINAMQGARLSGEGQQPNEPFDRENEGWVSWALLINISNPESSTLVSSVHAPRPNSTVIFFPYSYKEIWITKVLKEYKKFRTRGSMMKILGETKWKEVGKMLREQTEASNRNEITFCCHWLRNK